MLCTVLGKSVRRRTVASAVPASHCARELQALSVLGEGASPVGIKLATEAVALQFTIVA